MQELPPIQSLFHFTYICLFDGMDRFYMLPTMYMWYDMYANASDKRNWEHTQTHIHTDTIILNWAKNRDQRNIKTWITTTTTNNNTSQNWWIYYGMCVACDLSIGPLTLYSCCSIRLCLGCNCVYVWVPSISNWHYCKVKISSSIDRFYRWHFYLFIASTSASPYYTSFPYLLCI